MKTTAFSTKPFLDQANICSPLQVTTGKGSSSSNVLSLRTTDILHSNQWLSQLLFARQWQFTIENLRMLPLKANHHANLTTALLSTFSTKGVVTQNGPSVEQCAKRCTSLILYPLCDSFPDLPKLPVSVEPQFSVHPPFSLCIQEKALPFGATHIMSDLDWRPEVFCRLVVTQQFSLKGLGMFQHPLWL